MSQWSSWPTGMVGNINGASSAKTKMEAWDRAKVVQEEVNGEPIANGNGAGRAKTKLMEMVVKRTQRGLKQCQNLEAPVGRPSRKWKPCKVSCRPQGNKNCSKPRKFFLADSIAHGPLPEAWGTAFSSAKPS